MADFSIAFDYMILNEDYPPDNPKYGKTNVDNDGGKVRFGVNSNSFPDLLQTSFYTSMPVDQAINFVKNLYNNNQWRSIRGDVLASQLVASKMLDMSINMGAVQAVKLAQRAANVSVDGIMGPQTIGAINKMDETTMLNGLVTWWKWFIGKIQENATVSYNQQTIEAWTARAEKLPTAA